MNKHVYTKEQLDLMSNLELTYACSDKLGYPIIYINCYGVIVFNGVDQVVFDPLENYNDCMPIVEKYGLVVKPSLIKCNVVKTWSCNDRRFRPLRNGVSMLECVSIQPTIQRAIVYCYLMMEV